MSFSRESKEEILKTDIEDDSAALAFLAGLIYSCGEIEKLNNKIYVKIVSDVENSLVSAKKLSSDFTEMMSNLKFRKITASTKTLFMKFLLKWKNLNRFCLMSA